ncbi:MAG TPA: AMP-binding protein [Gemmatimonadales bacterium]
MSVATRANSNVAALLGGPVASRPDAPALIEGSGARERATTFAALDLRARRAAALLRSRGVGAGDTVLFFEAPGAELYAALVAVFRLGAVAMFVEPSAGRTVLESACAMLPPRALVASHRAHLLRLLSPALRRIPVKLVTRGWAPGAARLGAADALPPDEELAMVDVDAPALLTFTSGTTGRPKGAVRTHGVLRAQLDALGGVAARAGERELVSLPIVVLLNLASGAETVIPDADLRRPGEIDPAPVLSQVERHGVTRITASPAFLERMVDAAEDGALGGIRTIVTGGGPVFPDIVERASRAAPHARVVSVYGSTEAEPIAHVTDREVTPRDREAMRDGAGLLAGEPSPVVELRIVEPRWGTPVPPLDAAALDDWTVASGDAGEIVVTGAHVVPGYLNGTGDEETKFRVDGRVWHRTGDLGRLDAAGRLWLLGRAAAVIEDGRGTLFPFAVECAARERLGLRRVAVVARDGRRVLVAEAPPRGELDRARALEALAWAELDDLVVVPRLPMDRRHNSKVDHQGVLTILERARQR